MSRPYTFAVRATKVFRITRDMGELREYSVISPDYRPQDSMYNALALIDRWATKDFHHNPSDVTRSILEPVGASYTYYIRFPKGI